MLVVVGMLDGFVSKCHGVLTYDAARRSRPCGAEEPGGGLCQGREESWDRCKFFVVALPPLADGKSHS
jgi:hypothetical protein